MRITKVKKDKIKLFDFSKKPIRSCFPMWAAKWIISWPDLRKSIKKELYIKFRKKSQIEEF